MNVSRFLLWMQQRGWPVMLYADPNSGIMSHAAQLGIPSRPFAKPSEMSALWRSRALTRLAAQDGVRVLILHQSPDTLVCSLAKHWSDGKLNLVFSQNMHLGNKRDLIHAWQYRQLDAFVSPLPILAKQARQQTVVSPERIHVIPHGIELAQFISRIDRFKARQELGLPLDATIIGTIGRLDPKKGQHVGIKALARLREDGLKAHLLIVGDSTVGAGDQYRLSLQEMVTQLGLAEFVHFRPYLDLPALAYGAMDIFVLTSQSETYGLVTIEAMASGLPVIGTDSGGTVDIIEHEHNGLRFPPDDASALASALERYLTDPSLTARFAAQAKADALARYSHIHQCESWERLLRTICR
jgi:glycosyltransferase involved in cell wall biosynthesis